MKKQLLLLAVAVGFCLSTIHAQTSGGPDAYGYKWRSNADAQGPQYKWIDITTRQGAIDLTDKFDDDSNFGPINFSFDFPYYWYSRSFLYIGSNGYIAFQPYQLAPSFPAIPTEGGVLDDYMAVFAADLSYANDGNPGEVWFYTDFKDTTVVSWINVPFFAPGSYQGANTFQVILSRADSSITFQYMLQAGKDVGGGQSIGIENVNGKVGLGIPASLITGTTPATAKTFRFYRPAKSSYTIKDAAVIWNGNQDNGGEFIPMNGVSPKLQTFISNVGLEPIPSTPVNAKVYKGTKVVTQSNKASGSLEPGESVLFDPGISVPTTAEAIYRYEATIKATDDKASSNNKLSQLFAVIDATKPEMDLNYAEGSGSSVSFTGGVNGKSGLGTYIKSPVYPVLITHVLAGLSGPGTRIRIQDDNGFDLFGEPNGSPGDTLFEQDYPIDDGDVEFELPTPIQINSGGVYIAALQLTQASGLSTDIAEPHSYRSFEVLNGVYSVFRFRKTQDPNLGIRVKKTDANNVPDVGISRLIAPFQEQEITDSVQVKVMLKNFGPTVISTPFEVGYRTDTRAEVRETFSGTLAIGDSVEFVFKKKLQRPPPPNTNYTYFCAKTRLNNDFDLTNDELCYGTQTSITNEEDNIVGNLFIFPNPADDELMVIYGLTKAGSSLIEIINTAGQCVLKTEPVEQPAGMYKHTIDISALPNGIYLARVISTKGIKAGRFVKN